MQFGIIAAVIVVLFGCAACGGGDSPSAGQRATEASADQPLSPGPLPDEGKPETPEQTARDVEEAQRQAETGREQVRMASDLTEAHSAHRIQVQKCEALSGAERTSCIATADRTLEEAREREKKELERKTN